LKDVKPEITKKDLEEVFQSYGEVISVGIKKWEDTKNARNLHHAFVAFKSVEDAKKTLT
jgi:RNA recognition motif-containing protein